MLSKQQIKIIRSLHLKKNRKQSGLFVCEGAKILHELLHSSLQINKIYALKSWISENRQFLSDENTFQEVTEKELEQISELSTPNEVLAIAVIPENKIPEIKGLSIGLESIRDPGNLGTIIRIADWYGLTDIFCSEDCADAYNSKVVQASMGSLFRVRVHYVDLKEFLSSCTVPKYAAALEGSQNLHDYKDFNGNGILVIGNESNGLSSEILDVCDVKIHIPRFGQAESLNAAVATGIFLDAMKR